MTIRINTGFNRRDVIIYSLGVGAVELPFTYENHESFRPIPTILFSLTLKGDATDTQPFPPPFFPPDEVAIRGPVLDGERYLELYRPLRETESLEMETVTVAIARKGSGAIVQSETTFRDQEGQLVGRIFSGTFYAGSRDCDERGELRLFTRPVPADRQPDRVIEEHVLPQLPAIYRLSGDYNPLHIDPEFASTFSFPKPIMHGLCTLGFAVRIIIRELMKNDAAAVKRVACRFSKPSYPDTVLRVEIWQTSRGVVSFRVIDRGTGSIVVDHAYVEFEPVNSSKL